MFTTADESGKKLKVSVIVPVYNVKQYLVEALDSVVNQTYEDMEIILVDDGSTDGSSDICDEYAAKDSRIRLIRQDNQGLSAARNAGLDVMVGDVVAFLDSDDAYQRAFVELMVHTMEREDADIVLCKRTQHYTNGMMKNKEKGRIDPTIAEGVYNRERTLQLFAEGKINPGVWNKIYKRKLWENVRFPEGHVYEDTDTTFRIFDICTKMCVINKALYKYRKRSDSITGTPSAKNIRDWVLSRDHFVVYIDEHIPEVFTVRQKRKVLRAQFYGMISMYGRYRKKRGKDLLFDEKLAKKIVATAKQLNLSEEGVRTRVLLFLMQYCPNAIRVIYRTFYPVWQRIQYVVDG